MPNMPGTPQVSVICNTYNHGPYIRSALEGFVMQETDFPFEVFVHDDASSDETPQIIEEYAQRYPGLIKPILEEENQHSRGVAITLDIVLPRVQGRYVAFCEGDDFWIDAHKLQRQYEYMESNEDCQICIHNAIVEAQRYGYAYYSEPVGEDRDKAFAQLLREGCGVMNCTSSFFVRTSVLRNHVETSRDFVMLTTAATLGRVRWLGEPMSVYRQGVAGSYTERSGSFDVQRVQAEADQRVAYLERISRGLDEEDREAVGLAIERRKRNAEWGVDVRRFLAGEVGIAALSRKWGWFSAMRIAARRLPRRIKSWGGHLRDVTAQKKRGCYISSRELEALMSGQAVHSHEQPDSECVEVPRR